MKALISGIKRMEIHDGDGLRTTVFFKGCPLKCVWCHNPESISYMKQIALFGEKCIQCGNCMKACTKNAVSMGEEHAVIDRSKCDNCMECEAGCPTGAIVQYGKEYEVQELLEIILQDKLFFRNSNGGVTFSGGECLTQPGFVTELAKQLWERKISVDIDTCGFISRDILDGIIPYVDTFLYDIKAIDPQVHMRCTGQDNTLILENLIYLCNQGCKVEIRYPYVKGFNDMEYEKIIDFVKGLNGITKVKVLQYHDFAASRYEALGMKNTLPPVVD